MLSHHDTVRDATEAGLARMIGVMAAVMPSAALIQVLANVHDYRQPAVAVVVWLAVLAAAARLVPRIRGDGLSRGEAAATVLLAAAAVAVVGWEHHGRGATGGADLAILGTAWLLALVALSRPAREWVPAALLVFAVHAVLVIRAVGASPLTLSQLQVASYILAAFLTAFAALRPTLAAHTQMSARRAWLASRSSAERAAATAVQADRQGRLALLDLEVLSLLRGIAEGTLDPAQVRERCARQAELLRHSLTDRAPAAGELMAGLKPVLHAASAQGLLVNVQVIGDPGAPDPAVAQAAVAAVAAVTSALPPHQVMLTVLAPGDDVELYLTFDKPLRVIPDLTRYGRDVPAAAGWHASLDAGSGCLELGWRRGAGAA